MRTFGRDEINFAYQFFMLFLCVYAIAALTAGAVFPLSADTKTVIQYADFAVCSIFFVDFLNSLYRAPDRWKYLRTWGWIDLLSSVPAVDAVRLGRIARVVRILRVLRALKATKLVTGYWVRQRAHSAVYIALTVSFSMALLCSIAILHFEQGVGNIQSAEDAIWWAMSTITTVGYGDRFPVTTEGRAIAAMLMTVGVGLFSTLAGVVASWFLSPGEEEEQSEIAALRAQVGELQVAIETLTRAIEAGAPSGSPPVQGAQPTTVERGPVPKSA